MIALFMDAWMDTYMDEGEQDSGINYWVVLSWKGINRCVCM